MSTGASGQTKPKRNGPGRPTGGDSDKTRQRLIVVARRHFAKVGYASAAVTTIAEDAGLTPAALYYYFKGKAELYEAVYHATAPEVWTAMEDAAAATSGMIEGIEALIRSTRSRNVPAVNSRFLSALPTVAQLHPEFLHLLDDRLRIQERVFRSLAERGAETGELGALSIDDGAEYLRVAVMGYFLERYHRLDRPDVSIGPLLAGLRALAASARD